MITIYSINKVIIVIDNGKRYIIKSPYFSLRRHRTIKGRSVVIGFVGPRGSGKSVGGARLTILDFILKGVTNVWSNMDINFRYNINGKSGEFHSKPIDKLTLVDLDKVYSDGLIFEDEVNMAIADSRRSTSRSTLAFDYVIQQLRKRRLNLIWTAQSEDQVEMRLRNATDIFVKAYDVSLKNEKCDIGEFSKYKCYDYAGLINEELPSRTFDGVFEEPIIWNKPWWNSYSTWQLQGIEEETQAIPESRNSAILTEIEKFVRECEEPIDQNLVWAKWSIREANDKREIRKLLGSQGIMSVDKSRKFIPEELYADMS